MKWATADDLGIIAFGTKSDLVRAFPQRRAVRCEFAFGFVGWLALDMHGTENGNTVKTPDGREIPVVYGFTSAHGQLIGMRGGRPRSKFEEHWRAIMVRVVDAGLDLHAYRQAGNG